MLSSLADLANRVAGNAFDLGAALADPASMPSAALDLGRTWRFRLESGLRTVASGHGGTALDEIANKAEIFVLVLTVGRILEVPSTGRLPLAELCRRVEGTLSPFRALWGYEGLGHDAAARELALGAEPAGILDERHQPGLRRESLLMLHAGLGLAFAQQGLRAIGCRASDGAVEAIVERFVRRCRENARPGYLGAALESLGLQTYDFHPTRLTPRIDAALRRVAPETVPYFWHGVGRALYFDMPSGMLPCSSWEAFERARRLAPDEPARLGAWAGLAWAWTLVNQRQPQIVAELLVGPHGDALAADPGFANGVASASMMRWDTTPGAPFIAGFLDHRPNDLGVERAWRVLVREPGRHALAVQYPVLRRRRRLGDVFRFQDLDALVTRLETNRGHDGPGGDGLLAVGGEAA